jgi:arylsulfatase
LGILDFGLEVACSHLKFPVSNLSFRLFRYFRLFRTLSFALIGMLTQLNPILCFLLLFAAIALEQIQAQSRAKPNILILYADDWRHDTLGIAGNPIVKTPNIDGLARDGVRFTRAHVTTSICGVSRATLFTGQWMARHGNPAFEMFKSPWSETYPGLLRANGYYVGHIGKWHNGKFPAENFDFGRSYAGTHYLKQKDGSTIHVTQKNENDALEFLRDRPKDKPFVLTLAFFATHAEDQNPKQYLYQSQSESLYQNVTIPIPKTAGDEYFNHLPKFIANEKNEGRNRWHWRFDTPEKYQQYMKAYYRLATEVDSTIGRILAQLKANGLDDNTLVIFTTDNGYFHGEHGLADKWYPYQESIRVPLIVRDPRLPKNKRGTTNDDFVLNVDTAPTILAATGIAAPAQMQGRDFAPLYLAAKKPGWRQEFFYEHATIRNTDFIPSSEALVRRDVKYIYWPDFKTEELFDLKRDPSEERNIVNDPKYSKTLAALRTRFAELKAQARSPPRSFLTGLTKFWAGLTGLIQ